MWLLVKESLCTLFISQNSSVEQFCSNSVCFKIILNCYVFLSRFRSNAVSLVRLLSAVYSANRCSPNPITAMTYNLSYSSSFCLSFTLLLVFRKFLVRVGVLWVRIVQKAPLRKYCFYSLIPELLLPLAIRTFPASKCGPTDCICHHCFTFVICYILKSDFLTYK